MAGQVDVWMGQAKTKRDYEAYLREQYKHDDQPTNAFCGDQGESFVDHDFLDTQYIPKASSHDELLTGISYSSSFRDAVNETVWQNGTNFIIADFKTQFSKPTSVEKEKISLCYLGRLDYDPKAEPYGLREVYSTLDITIADGHEFEYLRKMTNQVRIDFFGLAVGSEDSPYMNTWLIPGIASFQARFSINAKQEWQLLDVGNNGMTKLNGQTLTGELVQVKPGDTISVGDVDLKLSNPCETEA
jgi:hypothetical protein